MRVRRIFVAGLFGIFDHDIPLHADERITIIHGQNGFGKTVVLRMLDGILRGRYAPLRAVPFTSLSVDFDDGSTLRVEKLDAPSVPRESSSGSDLCFTHRVPGGKDLSFTPGYNVPRSTKFTDDLNRMFRSLRSPSLTRIDSTTWQNEYTGEQLTFEDIIEQFGEQLQLPTGAWRNDEPEWLKAIHESIPVRLIQTQRLDVRSVTPDPIYGRAQPSAVPAVKKYSEELAAEMQSALGRYAAKSQDLDRTFPVRLLQTSPTPVPSEENERRIEEIKRRLEALERKRIRLTELGFLDPKDDLAVPPDVKTDQIGVLSIYVRDVEAKLSVFDDLAEKIGLLTEIVKNRFQYKQMLISRDHGFVFTTAKGDPLPPTGLSSGEQHEIILLYELLFKVSPKSLILIDEPEISLHLAWQVEFLNDLQTMVKISDFDVIIATHSAYIIGKRWDLTVELKGPVR